jgi:hypothetical protein
MKRPGALTFCWWNLHNFAHHDLARASHRRWPARQGDYEARRDRALAALAELFGKRYPHLLAVCEVTREAAHDLAGRLPGVYHVALPPPYPREDGFHVAVFFRAGIGLTAEPPIIPAETEDVTEGTRPMLPVHLTLPGHVIRFVACHWTAFDNASSRVARERLADVLRRDSHAFLEPPVPTAGLERHLVILGDLNEEPTAKVFRERLIGRRDRASSHQRHWMDREVRRVRLYNAAWRYLGEQVAHGTAGWPDGPAGTLYNDSEDAETTGWRAFDHVLLSLRRRRTWTNRGRGSGSRPS